MSLKTTKGTVLLHMAIILRAYNSPVDITDLNVIGSFNKGVYLNIILRGTKLKLSAYWLQR